MPHVDDVYVIADKLEMLPARCRENYLFESRLLERELAQNASVLQVGSMNGVRIARLLEVRPDLQLTGLEIEASFVEIAKQTLASQGKTAQFIAGDITNPPALAQFDYVICLNNTLGYIPNWEKALEEMKKLGRFVFVSVYGEKFDNTHAKEYFDTLHVEIEKIDDNIFSMKDFTNVKRFTREEVTSWEGKILETPLGYFCIINS